MRRRRPADQGPCRRTPQPTLGRPAGWPAVAWRRPAELLARVRPDAVVTVALGLLLAAVALGAGGGLQLGPTTRVEVGLEAAGGLLGAAAILAGGRRRMHGGLALALFGVLAALTAVSVLWSVQPDDTWLEANRTLSYLAAFGGGIALVRLAPERWSGVLGATLLACTIVSVYALTTKVFPGALAPDETYARLREPFGYWNAVGLMAALGIPGCLWLGRGARATRRSTRSPTRPAASCSSRSCWPTRAARCWPRSWAARFWFAVVPLRLRGVGGPARRARSARCCVAAWAFSQDALSKDQVAARPAHDHGPRAGRRARRDGPRAGRRRPGGRLRDRAPGAAARRPAARPASWILLVLALVPLGLARRPRVLRARPGRLDLQGLDGADRPQRAHAGQRPGPPDRGGQRALAVLQRGAEDRQGAPVLGAGAGGYATARPRFRNDDLDVRHAHGYAFQTFADLGILGLAANLALLLAWWRPRAARPASAAAGASSRSAPNGSGC